ncbi:MAG: RimK/LysX family protein [Candidatus Saccharimonadales bacterium]
MQRISKQTIGRVEPISLPDAGISGLAAKVDTGAYRSAIWATNIVEHDGTLSFTLLGESSELYSGVVMTTQEYLQVEVENSFGQKEMRYSVFLSVEIAGKKIRSNFTLANRAAKTYSALIGRKMLKGRFVVDVSLGTPLADEETQEAIQGDESLA